MIVSAEWVPYTLTLARPWQTAAGWIEVREGRLLRLQSDDGRIGWGDAAPLPEFGIDDNRAVAFAEETAHLDLAAQSAGLPLHAWLSGETAVERLAVNANLGTLCSTTPEDLIAASEAGHTVIKLKVGVASLSAEIRQLHLLAINLPATARLRLDANQGWSLTDAGHFIDACAGLPIDGLEEPIAQPDVDRLAFLQAKASFPVAIDESVALIDRRFLASPPVRRVVLKPARLGLLRSHELALRLRQAGVEIVVTHALESACGVMACAQLAAAMAPHGVHGLATVGWFEHDTGHSPVIESGRLALPERAGLGFEPADRYQSRSSTR